MQKPRDTNCLDFPSSYAGRWVAMVDGRVVGQGGTPKQAYVAAQSRHKEIPQVIYMPTTQPLNWSHLMTRIVTALPDGVTAYAVGGIVRDALLGRELHDWDFAVPTGALRVARIVADRLGGAYYPMDIEHDTARIVLVEDNNRVLIDFAGLRDGNLEDDLRARDFTINAMAVDVRQPDALLDPLGGLADLHAKILRACLSTSMGNDPVRVLRGVRQAAAFGFQIEPKTRELMRLAVPGLVRISPERKRDELFKMLDGIQPAACIRALGMLGVLPFLLPELSALRGVQQSPPHVAEDVWEHTLAVVTALDEILAALAPQYDPEKANNLALGQLVLRLGRFRDSLHKHLSDALNIDRPLRPLLFLAALYHDVAKPIVRSQDDVGRIHFFDHEIQGSKMIFERARALHLSNAETDRLKLIVQHHMRPLFLAQGDGSPTSRAVYRFFRDMDVAGVDVCLLSLADSLGTYGSSLPQNEWNSLLDVIRALLEAWWEHPQQAISPSALLNGRELIKELKLTPGPQVGKLLESIREAQVVGQVNDREEALALARDLIQHS